VHGVKRIFEIFLNEGWTYVIVTALTLLIWFWAASETRDQTVLYPTLKFVAAASAGQQWIVTPPDLTVTLRVEGSKRAIQEASAVVAHRLSIALPPPNDAGTVDLTLSQALEQQPELRETGVAVLSVDPGFYELRVDEIVEVNAQVRVELPGVQTEGEIVVEPRVVKLRMPQRLRPSAEEQLVVDAAVGPASNLSGLEPGKVHTLRDIPVRLPEALRGVQGVSFYPERVDITFTVKSRIQSTTINDVRVQISGDPKNFSEYTIEIVDEEVLRDVTVSAESELIQQIETGVAKVAAIVHLTTRDLEENITSKRVSHFRAIVNQPDHSDRGILVQASVDGDEAPVINLKITRREVP